MSALVRGQQRRHTRRIVRLLRAEARSLLIGRRQGWALAVAVLGSLAGGAASSALVAQLGQMPALDAATTIVSRGSAALLAITLLAGLGVAGPYRDGAWVHAALAVPGPTRRLIIAASPVIALGLLLAAVAALAAILGAAVVALPAASAIVIAVSAHLAIAALWSLWMLLLAHAIRSPMGVLAIGAGLPLVVEPLVGGLLAQTSTPEVRWLLPSTALRAIGELPVVEGVVIARLDPQLVPLVVAVVAGWTAVLAAAAWLRMRSPQPR